MGKLQEKKQQKEEKLLNAAFHLFTSKGIAKTSIADIVEQAGMAKGTFYLYFRDKYELREKLVTHKARQLVEHALTHSDYPRLSSTADQLIAILDDILNQMQRNPTILRFINKNLSWGVFSRALNRTELGCQEVFMDILCTDGNTWRNPEIMLFTIIELVGSTCHSVILENDPVSLEDFKPDLYRTVRAILESFRA